MQCTEFFCGELKRISRICFAISHYTPSPFVLSLEFIFWWHRIPEKSQDMALFRRISCLSDGFRLNACGIQKIKPSSRISVYFNPWDVVAWDACGAKFAMATISRDVSGALFKLFYSLSPFPPCLARRTSLIEEPGHKLHPSLPPPYAACIALLIHRMPTQRVAVSHSYLNWELYFSAVNCPFPGSGFMQTRPVRWCIGNIYGELVVVTVFLDISARKYASTHFVSYALTSVAHAAGKTNILFVFGFTNTLKKLRCVQQFSILRIYLIFCLLISLALSHQQ